mmetsp:Transcript_991/g.3118  ORF Transcript_991/g.3118 Transcript_991/m.3118 type:complete len:254 (+) Transcript_991:37-798(+)
MSPLEQISLISSDEESEATPQAAARAKRSAAARSAPSSPPPSRKARKTDAGRAAAPSRKARKDPAAPNAEDPPAAAAARPAPSASQRASYLQARGARGKAQGVPLQPLRPPRRQARARHLANHQEADAGVGGLLASAARVDAKHDRSPRPGAARPAELGTVAARRAAGRPARHPRLHRLSLRRRAGLRHRGGGGRAADPAALHLPAAPACARDGRARRWQGRRRDRGRLWRRLQDGGGGAARPARLPHHTLDL